ncbi:MAG: hypothetical protein ACE5H7_13970 [Acidiferrobacterales bacterium]
MPPDLIRLLTELLQKPNSPLALLLAGRGLSAFLKDFQKLMPQGVRLEGTNKPGVTVAPSASNAPIPQSLTQPGIGNQQQLASQLAALQTFRRGTGRLGGGRI